MLRGSGLAGLSSSVYNCKVKTGTCQSLIPAANEQNSYQPHRPGQVVLYTSISPLLSPLSSPLLVYRTTWPGPWSPVHGAHSWDISDKRRQLNVKLIQGRRQVAWRTHQQATKCPYSSLISLADRDRPTDSPELLVTSSLLNQCRVAKAALTRRRSSSSWGLRFRWL